MKKKYLFLLMIFILSFSIFVYAQETSYDGSETGLTACTSNCEEKFDYANGDYSEIENWDKFDDWDQIPPNRIKDVPADKLKYDKLNNDQKKSMTSEQISENFDNIDDLSADVDKEQAQKAIKEKYDANVDLAGGASLKNGVLLAKGEYKDSVSLEGENYKSGILIVDSSGEIIFIPNGKHLDVPETDQLTIDTQEQETLLSDGKTFKGKLSYKNGQAYVIGGDQAIINNIRIGGKDIYEEIYVYFDGEEKETKNYVSLDDSGTIIISSSYEAGESVVVFDQGNPYVDVEENDFLGIKLKAPSTIIIKNRDGQGLIPSVNIKIDADQDDGARAVELTSGIIGLSFTKDGNIYNMGYSTFHERSGDGSVPLSIQFTDEAGENLIGSEDEPKKLIISNYNEVGTIPLGEEEGTLEKEDYIPAKLSERLDFNDGSLFSAEAFNERFPNINLEGTESSATIKQMTDMLEFIGDGPMRDSITGILILPQEEYDKISPPGTIAWTDEDGIIRLSSGDTSKETLTHESGHTLTFSIQNEEDKEYSKRTIEYLKSNPEPEIKKKIEEAGSIHEEAKNIDKKANLEKEKLRNERDEKVKQLETQGLDSTSVEEEYNIKIQKIDGEFRIEYDTLMEKYDSMNKEIRETLGMEETLQTKWTKIAESQGYSYGDDLDKKQLEDYYEGKSSLPTKWEDGSNGPKNGCIHAYGCNDYLEDIATFTGKVYANPEFFKTRINKNSQDYDERYRQKLDLLHEEGFVDEKRYNEIIAYAET